MTGKSTDAEICEHSWRLHESRKTQHYQPGSDPWHTTVVVPAMVSESTHDTWYCTKCRLIEERLRG